MYFLHLVAVRVTCRADTRNMRVNTRKNLWLHQVQVTKLLSDEESYTGLLD